MTVESIRAGGDFRVGDVFSRAWTLLTANILFFIGVSALVYGAIIAAVVVIAIAAGQLGGSSVGTPIIVVLSIAAGIFAFAAIMASEATLLFGAFQYLRGLPVRVGESLQRALRRLGPLIGLGLLSSFAMFLGLILLVVPGVILFCMWVVAVPVCLVEGLGPTASLSRSAALTKGYRWQIFGIFALIFIVRLVSSPLVELALRPISPVLGSIAGVIVSTLLALYGYCVVIMTYHDLRVAKEGVDTTQIASVFD